MLVLALDTAADLCAACLWDTAMAAERGRAMLAMRTGHAERLTDVIEKALEEARTGFGELSRIAVSVGPGSFTGIRVGVATARGLALALKIPAVGISTLEALAAQAREEHGALPVLALLPAGEDRVQAALYGGEGEELHPPSSIGIDTALDWAAEAQGLAGSAVPQIVAAMPNKAIAAVAGTADIAVYARLGAGRSPGAKPVPLYGRAPDAKPQTAAVLPRRES